MNNNALNQLVARNGAKLAYDANGNMTGDGKRTFTYDDANRLVQIVQAGQHKTEFAYDGLNRKRVARKFDWANGTWKQTAETRYIYDGLNVVQERDGKDVVVATYTRGLDIGSGVYENGLGGRVAVFGYYPWQMLQTLAKSSQVKTVCGWLAGGKLPAFVASYHKAALWCRRDENGRPALLLLNASLDASTIEVCVPHAQTLQITRMDGRSETAKLTTSETAKTAAPHDAPATFVIPNVAPWQAVLLRTG